MTTMTFTQPIPLGLAETPSTAMREEMIQHLDTLLIAVGSFEAHYHNFGQSTWLGGDSWKNPTVDMKHLFERLKVAREAIASASHAVQMAILKEPS